MRASLKKLYDWIELRPLTGAAIARWTGLKGPLCRRVVAAVQHAGEPAELARILPGTEGLTLFVDALAERGCPPARIEKAREAIHAFADLQHHGGGSQRRLVAAVEAALGASEGAADQSGGADARRRLWTAARDLTGSTLTAMVPISIVFRAAEDPLRLDSVSALGQLGYRARPGAGPLMAKHYAAAGIDNEEAPGQPGAPGALHDRFGTPGLEIARSRIDDTRVLTTYDGTGDRPIDVWTGPVTNRGVTEITPGEQNVYGTFAAIRTPTRSFVGDLWVERALAHRGVVRTGAYRMTPDALTDIDYDTWYDRLPGEQSVVSPAALPSIDLEGLHPEHAAVVAHCFEFAARSSEDFVCYRYQVEHPIWMSLYRMTFEFAG